MCFHVKNCTVIFFLNRLFEEEPNVPRSVSMSSSVATTTADSGFIAMIRTGIVIYFEISNIKYNDNTNVFMCA